MFALSGHMKAHKGDKSENQVKADPQSVYKKRKSDANDEEVDTKRSKRETTTETNIRKSVGMEEPPKRSMSRSSNVENIVVDSSRTRGKTTGK